MHRLKTNAAFHPLWTYFNLHKTRLLPQHFCAFQMYMVHFPNPKTLIKGDKRTVVYVFHEFFSPFISKCNCHVGSDLVDELVTNSYDLENWRSKSPKCHSSAQILCGLLHSVTHSCTSNFGVSTQETKNISGKDIVKSTLHRHLSLL